MNRRIAILLKIIAFAECLLGCALLLNEINVYYHSYSVHEADNLFGGLVSMFKYRESCYRNLFLYSLVIITGISFWINKKLYWGLTQVLIITLFFVIITNLWFRSYVPILASVILSIFTLCIFGYFEIKMYNSLFLKTVGISNMVKWLSIFFGLLSFAVWFMLLGY